MLNYQSLSSTMRGLVRDTPPLIVALGGKKRGLNGTATANMFRSGGGGGNPCSLFALLASPCARRTWRHRRENDYKRGATRRVSAPGDRQTHNLKNISTKRGIKQSGLRPLTRTRWAREMGSLLFGCLQLRLKGW